VMTTSIIPAVEKALLDRLVEACSSTTGLESVVVAESWPGPSAGHEMLFLDWDIPVWDLNIPNLTGAARKQRDERFTLEVIAWVFRPDLTPSQVRTAKARVHQIIDLVDDVLANNPTLDVPGVVVAAASGGSRQVIAYEKGYAVQATRSVDVHARLL
jgi:hypothetical protein